MKFSSFQVINLQRRQGATCKLLTYLLKNIL